MAEKLGRIEYEVAAETDGVLKAGAVVDKTTDGMVKSFNKADQSVKTLNTQMTKTAQSVRRARPDIQNISYQLQDMAVQAQMGTSAFVIMSQQLPQMLAGMGAVAGVIGFAITALGLMATTLIDTSTNAEKLEKAIEQVKAVMTVGANGVANYSEELKELNRVSENLAKIKLAIALTDNQKALSGIKSEFANLRSSLFNFQEDSDEAAKRLTGLTSKASDITALASSLQALTKVTDDDSKLALLDSIEERLLSLRSSDGSFPTSALKAFADEFFTLSNNTRQAIEQNKLLKESQDGLIDSGKNTSEAFEQQRIALKTQRIELEQGQTAAYKYALLMSGDFTAAQIESLVAMKETNDGLIEQERLRKQSSDALEDEIDAYIKLGEEVTKAEERKAAAAQREKDRLAQRGTTVGLTQVQVVETRYKDDLDALIAAREQKLITEQQYADREVELQRQKAEQIKQINQQQLQNQALFTQSQGQLLNSLGGLFGAYASTMDAQDKESFEKKKKFQTAQALINTAMAISNALAAAPPPINFALAAASGAAGAIQVAAIQNQQFSGGRQYGGPVSQGMYRVNETGVPEIYSHGGKDYLMNTKNANIKPLKEASGGWTINVENYGPDKVYTTIDDVNRAVNIGIAREAGKAAKGQGTLLKGVMAGTNTTKRARN